MGCSTILYGPSAEAGAGKLRRLAAALKDSGLVTVARPSGGVVEIHLDPSRESAFHIWLRILADMIHNYRDAKDFCAGFPRDLSLSARRNPSNIRQFAPFFHYDEEVPGSLVLYFPLATPHDPRLDPVITDTGAVIPLESVLGNMEDC